MGDSIMLRRTIDKETISELPKGEFEGTIKVISRPEEIDDVIPEIAIHNVLGFDTETKPAFRKGRSHGVSLLQLSSEDITWLFRLQMTGFSNSLIKILSSKTIIKVGAAILDDIRALKKIQYFEDKGFVDLQKHVHEYGVEEKGVKKMAAIFLGKRISKRQRLTNWEAPVLTEPQRRYAATDAWVCLKIYKTMQEIQPFDS